MKLVAIDGAAVNALSQIHDIIADELHFPCWYGRNLDALHDCLTDIDDETLICISSFEKLTEALGSRASALKRVLTESSIENPKIKLTFTE